MKITIKLFASLRQGRFKVREEICPDNTTVGDMVARLAIPPGDLGIVFVNGKGAEITAQLQEGDVLSLFPLVGGG